MSAAQTTGNFSMFGQADEYFEKNVLPKDIKGYQRIITRITPYNHSHDTHYVYVRSGTGILTVNGLDYKLTPGTLTCLSPFNRYRYAPDPGQKLDIVECRFNSGVYVYLISNPYYKIKHFDVPTEPPIVRATGFMKDIAKQAIEGILAETAKNRADSTDLLFCYITDLAGVIYDGIASGRIVKPIDYSK